MLSLKSNNAGETCNENYVKNYDKYNISIIYNNKYTINTNINPT